MTAKFVWLAACIFHLSMSQSSHASISCPGHTGDPGSRGSGAAGSPGAAGTVGAAGPNGADGPVGADGPKGADGPVGAAGPEGLPGPPGGGTSSSKNWKQCAWYGLNDNRGYGLLKVCTFTKRELNTALKVEFIGNYRVCCCLNCCKRWFITFHNVECRRPQAIEGIHHIVNNHYRTDTDIHKTGVIAGYCEGISAGTVSVGINIGDCAGRGKKPASSSFTGGYNEVTRIMIEEVPPSQ